MSRYVSPLDPHPGESDFPTGLRRGPQGEVSSGRLLEPTPTRRRTGRVTWAGLGVVLVAAAVLSFHALRDLGLAVGIPAYLAWLLPIAVDAGAAVSCSAWLSNRCPDDAATFARSMTFGLLGLTVIGNAAELGMRAASIVAPWWVAVAVGAIPPAIVGAAVHLAVLAARKPSEGAEIAVEEIDEDTWPEEPIDWWKKAPPAEAPTDDPPVDSLLDRARQLVADGAGRPTLRKELQISDYRAKVLLAQLQDEEAS